jgi:hypothetical protein
MEMAMETTPESFGSVIMLYINCKYDNKLRAESQDILPLFFYAVFVSWAILSRFELFSNSYRVFGNQWSGSSLICLILPDSDPHPDSDR